MTATSFYDGEILTASELQSAFAGSLSKVGDQVAGAFGVSNSLTIGPITNPDTQGAGIYASANITTNRTGNYAAYSVIQTQVNFSSATPLDFIPVPNVYGVLVNTYNYPPTSSPGTSGQTYVVEGLDMVQGLPPGVTMAQLEAAFTGGALLPPVEACNAIVTNGGLYNNTSRTNAMVGYELDHQLAGGWDDIAARSGFTHNLSVDYGAGWTGASANTAQGIPTVSASFQSIGLSPGSIVMGFRAAGNVQAAFCARDIGSVTAQITAAPTTIASNAPTGTLPPAAAPASISGGAVIHVGPTTSFTGYYSGLVGFGHGTVTGGLVSPTNPLTIRLNGNLYHVVGIQWDGLGYNSGYLQLKEALVAGDGATGQQLTATAFGLLMSSFQAVGWEPTGTALSYYDPTQFSSTGAVVTTANAQITGSFSIATGQALTGSVPLYPFTYSPRDGGHYMQWNPFTNQTEWYDEAGNTSNLRLALNVGTGLDSPGGFNVSGKTIADGNGNSTVSAGLVIANHKVTALTSATASYSFGAEQLTSVTYTGSVTSLTVTLPTPIGNGDVRRLTVTQPVASLVVKNAAGTTLSGFPTSIAAGYGVTAMYDATNSTWYPA